MNPQWLYLGGNENSLSHAKHGWEQQRWQLAFSILWRKFFKSFLSFLCTYLDLTALFFLQGSSTGPVLFWAGASQCIWDKVLWYHSVLTWKATFSFLFLGFLYSWWKNVSHKETCSISASPLQCLLGFCWFTQGWGPALTPVWSVGGQPSCCSPQCLSITNLSTAGCFHGDHSWAGLHGYSGTLAVGWGAAVDGWGYPAVLGQLSWRAAGHDWGQ